MMKKLLASLLAVFLLLGVTGCGQSSESKNETTTAAVTTAAETKAMETEKGELKQEDLKIAMLLPSSPTDGGWGQVGAAALNYAKTMLGCEAVIVEAAL